jgi:hypothetical protein
MKLSCAGVEARSQDLYTISCENFMKNNIGMYLGRIGKGYVPSHSILNYINIENSEEN